MLNRIANHPEVKPYFGPGGVEVYFDELAALPNDYALLCNGEDAGAIFEWSGPGIWQMHYLSLPSCRGRRCIAEFRRMIDWMFEQEGARTIWGQTPIANKAARWLNRQLGGTSYGIREHHISGPCELFKVER
ncbi:hypothetical protein ACFSTI_29280 [Rhizorhabdus histidinilytica]|uniref:hypothetical protein n=1 Tax=Rhizorhabdus histidinilytica TaxID=439228 RepID=UPI001115D166|nr:hypothetical protein [Rhizorhabdus histidinilytica]